MKNNLSARWAGVARRLQQVANSGNGGNARIVLTLLVDGDGQPRHILIDRQPIEPKSASLDWLLGLLSDENG